MKLCVGQLYGGHTDNAVCDYMAHGPMDQVLDQLIQSWKTMELPVRSIQLDDCKQHTRIVVILDTY